MPLENLYPKTKPEEYNTNYKSLLMGMTEKEVYCMFPMPFSNGAKIKLTNTGSNIAKLVELKLDVKKLKTILKNHGRFHVTWSQEKAATEASPKFGLSNIACKVFLDRRCKGKYVGSMLQVDWPKDIWWGEGDFLIWTDENGWPPSYHGTGSEEYFNSGWGMFDRKAVSGFVSLRPGFPTVYSFHLNDAFCFQKNILVVEEELALPHDMRDFKPMWSSTAFWYAEIPTDAESSKTTPPVKVRNLTPGIPSELDRGHRILLQRGLQLQTTVLDYKTFDVDEFKSSNFTTPDFWARDLAPQYLAPAPGKLPWARWTTWWTTNLDILTPVEQLYQETFVSIHHGDECDLSDTNNLNKIRDLLVRHRSLYPDTISFHNESAELSSFQETQGMMEYCQPDIIHAGSYPFGDTHAPKLRGGSPTWMYEAFEKYRKLSLLGNDGTGTTPIPFGMFIQTFYNEKRWDRPVSPSEATLEQYTAWAFGCKIINAFIYNGNFAVHGNLISLMFDDGENGTPTPFFHHISELNAQSLRLAPALVRLISTEVFMKMGRHKNKLRRNTDNPQPSGVPAWTSNAVEFITNVSAANLDSNIKDGLEGDVIIGSFKLLHESFDGPDFNNQIYFMLVNGLSNSNSTPDHTRQRIRLDFNFAKSGITSLQKINRTTGQVELIPLIHDGGSRYHLDLVLGGGEGDLFKFNTGAPFVGFPIPATNCSGLIPMALPIS